MKLLKLGWGIFALALCLSAGCGKNDSSPLKADKAVGDRGVQIQPGVMPKESENWGYLPLKIAKVYEKQKPLDQNPWHTDGGEWTFMDCQTAKDPGVQFVVGVHTKTPARGETPFGWGEAELAVSDAVAGARFVEAFSRAFHQPVPLSHGYNPAGRIKMNSAVLGVSLVRDPQGGFRGGRSGSWTGTKWFLQDDLNESEVFFNFSVAEKRAELSEKDEEYREGLVQQLVVGLRDGPLPERTPENDPSLTLTGPCVTNWVRIAGSNATCQFAPDSQKIVFIEAGDNSASKLYLAPVSQPAERKALAEFEGQISVSQFLPNIPDAPMLVLETLRKNLKVFSSSDPQRLWLVTIKGKTALPLEAGLTNWYMGKHALSPDGRFIALHNWITQPNKKRVRIIHLGDLGNGNWRTVALPDTPLELVAWTAENQQGMVLTGDGFDKTGPRKGYRLDPDSGKLSPLDSVPIEFLHGKATSPDHRRLIEVREKDRVIITDLAGREAREFVFHPYDRGNVYSESVEWASARYLVFQGQRTALIDVDTLKMNFPTAKESGFSNVEFSPDFKFALGSKEDGRYLGRVAGAESSKP